MEVWGLETTFFLQIHVLQIGPIMEVRGLEATKLYIPSTLNTDYLLWHTQLIVCAVKY